MPTFEPYGSRLPVKPVAAPRILFHGTGRWTDIRASGGLRPDASRVFSIETGGMASCGGIYLTDCVSHAAYIADRGARLCEIDGIGHRTVLALEVGASSLEADEDVLKELVDRTFKREGLELHREARAGKDAFWTALLERDGRRIIRDIVLDLGPPCESGTQGISERGIAAVIDRLCGPWDDLEVSEAAINAMTALHRELVDDLWFEARGFHDAPRNRRIRDLADGALRIVGSMTLTVQSETFVDRVISLEGAGDFPEDHAQSVLDGYYEAATAWDAEIDLSIFSGHPELLGPEGLPLVTASQPGP